MVNPRKKDYLVTMSGRGTAHHDDVTLEEIAETTSADVATQALKLVQNNQQQIHDT